MKPGQRPASGTNQAPAVSAGSPQTITLPSVSILNGTVTDDGLPNNALTIAWTMQSGPATVTFDNPSGVGAAPDGQTPGRNEVRLDLPFHDSLSQHKHHRWKLDSSQISQYGLGSILYPEREWWEHIGIDDRCFLFASLTADMVLSALVCEDLARPDPVGDLVRAVGPNLVIALLMDGPQIKERWSGRYAIVLADDPGCSVLTLTSAGMSRLSRPRDGKSRSRVIGLWKDAKNGIPQEIEMDDGSEGVVLSISMRYLEEWTADGRTDEGNAVYPVLSGIHCITRYTKK